ncbi:MAG TPA: helix-turn-helix domain-containing protein [Sphingobium sp.]|uniref:TetR/AcrR family transcriptional regulator n=1 Tax=Sphingobium sp. TaxID=1912891 RepID=UPI002ED5C5F1
MQKSKTPPERIRPYHERHVELITGAVRLISKRGTAGLSLSLLARELGVDRTTIYYHFNGKEALLREVRSWSANELAKAFSLAGDASERIRYTIRYAMENPELIKLWVNDLMDPDITIQETYPMWHNIVENITLQLRPEYQQIDLEIFFLNMLVSSVISPSVYQSKLHKGLSTEETITLFTDQILSMFTAAGVGSATRSSVPHNY